VLNVANALRQQVFLKKIAGPLHFEVGELLILAGYRPPLSEYEDEMQP